MTKRILLLVLAFCSFFHSKAQLISDFENWHNFTAGFTPLTIPNGWNATDSLICFYGATNPGGLYVSQVSEEVPGNGGIGKAMKITSRNQDALPTLLAAGPMPCIASNSKIAVNTGSGEFSFTGGTPFGYNPYTATLYVKTDIVGVDSTSITILAIDDSDGGDSIVAVADTVFWSSISTFTQITLPFNTLNPTFSTTKLRVIVISSSGFIIDATPAFINVNDGTSITVDDISISAPNGVSQYILSDNIAMVYPTAAQQELHVNLQPDDFNSYLMTVFDNQGKVLKSFQLNTQLNTLDISSFAGGNYFYSIGKGNKIMQNGKFSKL